MNTYQLNYKKIYDHNMFLKKAYDDYAKFTNTSEKQLHKYLDIHHNAMLSYKMQLNLYNNMKNYNIDNIKENEQIIDNKKILYKEAEIELLAVKDDIQEGDSLLEKLKKSISDTQKSIYERDRKIEKIKLENKYSLIEYLGINKNLYEIYRNLKVNDLDSIIIIFKEVQIHYQGNYSWVNFYVTHSILN